MNVRELRISYQPTGHQATIDGRRPITTADTAAAILRPQLEHEACEVFAVLLLNAKHRAIGVYIASRGTLDSAPIHPRDVFKAAVLANAAAIITAHNHPSGDPTPSPDDRAAWIRLDHAGAILGIDTLDHLIISHDAPTFSARAAGIAGGHHGS